MKYYLMSEKLRKTLSKHFIGLLLTGTPRENINYIKSNIKDYKYIITVGDVVTLTICLGGLQPKLSIIDYKCFRKKYPITDILKTKFKKIIKVNNPPSRITLEAWNSIKEALKSHESTLIEVFGEEDLLAIPAILEADINSLVIYGLPLKGMIIVKIDREVKNVIKNILKDFILVDEE